MANNLIIIGNNRGVAPAVLPTIYSSLWGSYRNRLNGTCSQYLYVLITVMVMCNVLLYMDVFLQDSKRYRALHYSILV